MDVYRHVWTSKERKGWDSNPRYPCGHAGFQDRCLKPLGHPSVLAASITWRKEYQERLGGAAADEALEMRFWGIFCVALLTLPAGPARAETRTVRSGVTTPIHTYLSWNNDCSPNTGV